MGTFHSAFFFPSNYSFSHFEARFLKTIQEGDYRTNNLTADVAVLVNKFFLKV